RGDAYFVALYIAPTEAFMTSTGVRALYSAWLCVLTAFSLLGNVTVFAQAPPTFSECGSALRGDEIGGTALSAQMAANRAVTVTMNITFPGRVSPASGQNVLACVFDGQLAQGSSSAPVASTGPSGADCS